MCACILCMYMWKTEWPQMSFFKKNPFFVIVLRQDLSLALNSPSRLGWLANNLQEPVCLSPALRSQVYSTMLDFSSWVVVEPRSLCLPGKLLTGSSLCLWILTCHGTTYLGLCKFGNKQKWSLHCTQATGNAQTILQVCLAPFKHFANICAVSFSEAKEEAENLHIIRCPVNVRGRIFPSID